MKSAKAPVVIFIYKRIDNLSEIFSSIRRYHPSKIFIISDGPKNKDEKKMINITRKAAESMVDWECNIHRIYARKNLGLKKRFSSGINKVFQQVDQAIFIEDDCLPDPTFFQFCEDLLVKYANDERVMSISGNNFFSGKSNNNSYSFSIYPHVWGWATWKRAWKKYDVDIENWPVIKNNKLLNSIFSSTRLQLYWLLIFQLVYMGKISTWDYQWVFACLANNGFSINPSCNLVSNVGIDSESTNTKIKSKVFRYPTRPMKFPLVHPKEIRQNIEADNRVGKKIFATNLNFISLFFRAIS